MRWSRLIWICLIWMLAVPAYAAAPPAPDCSNPRAAADSLFNWLQPKHHDPAKAKTCMDVPKGANGERLAVQLVQILDARAVYVPVSTLSADPKFDGDHIVPVEDFPVLSLTKSAEGQWRYSRDTVEAIPSLYKETFSPLSVWFQEQLPSPFYQRFLGMHMWQYLYGVLLLFAAWTTGQLVRILLRGQVLRLVRRAGLQLDDESYRQTNTPIVAMVTFGVLYWGLTDLQLSITLSTYLNMAAWILLWLAFLVSISRFINVGAVIARSWAAATDSKLDDQLIPLVRQAAQILLFVVGTLYMADEVGFDVWKLAAGVGIGGLAFALAAQDTVANVFGSVNIFVDKPFQIGDWVVIDGVEGVVEEVGFRSTRVRTFYDSIVTIPNSRITNANVDNYGHRRRRRVKMVLGLTYDTPPDKLQAYVEGIRAILALHPSVQRTYEVHIYNLGDSALEILVYYHLVVPGWSEELITRSQNILEFMRLAQELGVSFAFPSQSLYLEATPENPIKPGEDRSIAEMQAIADAFGPEGGLGRPQGPPFSRSWTVQARDERTDRGSAGDDGG